VLSALTAFVVLCGGAALAANELAKNSVGKKQLKANAVTTAKLKKAAVTAAKIKAGAVDGTKVKAGGLGAADLQVSGMPYTRIVEELRAPANASVVGTEGTFAPLPGLAYTQEAGRTDSYVAALDVTFDSSCVDAQFFSYLLMDVPPPTGPLSMSIIYDAIAVGGVERKGNAQVTQRVNLNAFELGSGSFKKSSPQAHTFALVFGGLCKAGSGISVGPVSIDVLGTK
jgi:hypothetical protein